MLPLQKQKGGCGSSNAALRNKKEGDQNLDHIFKGLPRTLNQDAIDHITSQPSHVLVGGRKNRHKWKGPNQTTSDSDEEEEEEEAPSTSRGLRPEPWDNISPEQRRKYNQDLKAKAEAQRRGQKYIAGFNYDPYYKQKAGATKMEIGGTTSRLTPRYERKHTKTKGHVVTECS